MSEIRPNIRTVRDVGYRVIAKNEDGTPKKVWRCLVKEGNYGKFISIEQQWVHRMDGTKIAESDWARKSITFPFDKDRAFGVWNTIMELLEAAFAEGAGSELEREVEAEFGSELEGLDDNF